MDKYIKCIILALSLTNTACHTNTDEFQLQIGDLLFQDLDSSPLCDAIELVTPGYKNANLSHIGIVVEVVNPYCTNNPDYNYKNHIKILEAIPNKVKTTRLDSFLSRSLDYNKNPKVIVGRLKPEYQHTIKDAISFLISKKNKKYDNAFLMNNDAYYCSELIFNAFEKHKIFKIQPMTFLDPKNNKTLKIWEDYYQDLKIKIPEGEPGLNPGNMSLSKKIDIIHYYGIPSGMEE
tara:strand:+ start:359 stop:1060 length:702 start_codon:yes stop_codon:yes gene_type:complete